QSLLASDESQDSAEVVRDHRLQILSIEQPAAFVIALGPSVVFGGAFNASAVGDFQNNLEREGLLVIRRCDRSAGADPTNQKRPLIDHNSILKPGRTAAQHAIPFRLGF